MKILTYTAVTALLAGLAGSSSKVQVPWVTAFSDVPSGSQFCVMAAQYGMDTPGLYTLQGDGSWKFSLDLANLNSALANGSTITLAINVSTVVTYAAPAIVYNDGQVVSGGATFADAVGTFVIVQPPANLPGIYTVATLPTAANAGKGTRAMVSDATSPTFGATVAGAGAVTIPVFSDGTNWKVG